VTIKIKVKKDYILVESLYGADVQEHAAFQPGDALGEDEKIGV